MYINLFSFFICYKFIYIFFGNFSTENSKTNVLVSSFIFHFLKIQSVIIHMYMTVQNVKCKDMNNLHHILNILFVFHSSVYNFTHMHAPPYIKSFIRPSSIPWKFDWKKKWNYIHWRRWKWDWKITGMIKFYLNHPTENQNSTRIILNKS